MPLFSLTPQIPQNRELSLTGLLHCGHPIFVPNVPLYGLGKASQNVPVTINFT